MLFPTLGFAVFFADRVRGGLAPPPVAERWKVFLLLASVVFFGWWDWRAAAWCWRRWSSWPELAARSVVAPAPAPVRGRACWRSARSSASSPRSWLVARVGHRRRSPSSASIVASRSSVCSSLPGHQLRRSTSTAACSSRRLRLDCCARPRRSSPTSSPGRSCAVAEFAARSCASRPTARSHPRGAGLPPADRRAVRGCG